MVLDLPAKVGFGFILLRGIGVVEGTLETAGATATAD